MRRALTGVGGSGDSCQTNGGLTLSSAGLTAIGESSDLAGTVAAGNKNTGSHSTVTFKLPEGFTDDGDDYKVKVTNDGELTILLKFGEVAEVVEGDVVPPIRFDFSVNQGLEAFIHNDNCYVGLGPPSIKVLVDGEEITSMVVGGSAE